MKNTTAFFYLITLCLFCFTACQDDDDVTPDYQIPTIYDFENVDYSGQQQRLAMLKEMKDYLTTANTSGVTLDANKLQAMYANEAGADWAMNYDASKQLKSKTFEGEQATFEQLLAAIAEASTSVTAGGNGQAGVVVSKSGDKKYLLNAKGVELTQLIEKGLMGACFFYQATSVYLAEGRMNVDNEIVEPGKGTEMEHHWDEAFGYLGVPIDFPTSTDGLSFWGNYCNRRDELLNTNTLLMDAFLRGRAAISNDDLEARNESIAVIRKNWEKVSAGTAIHYINSALANFDDMALRAHALSEAIAFTYALQFNEAKTLTNNQVSEILKDIAGDDQFFEMNLYEVEVPRLQAAKDALAEAFNWNDIKDDF